MHDSTFECSAADLEVARVVDHHDAIVLSDLLREPATEGLEKRGGSSSRQRRGC